MDIILTLGCDTIGRNKSRPPPGYATVAHSVAYIILMWWFLSSATPSVCIVFNIHRYAYYIENYVSTGAIVKYIHTFSTLHFSTYDRRKLVRYYYYTPFSNIQRTIQRIRKLSVQTSSNKWVGKSKLKRTVIA